MRGCHIQTLDIIVGEKDCDDPTDVTLDNFLMPESEINHEIE